MNLSNLSFVVIGQTATASGEFSLSDVAGTSGRLDALLRCIRATMLYSHGVRRNVTLYLLLLGGSLAPRILRISGSAAKYLRPDEQNLAPVIRKALMHASEGAPGGYTDLRNGYAIRDGGLADILRDTSAARRYVLREDGVDVRTVSEAGEANSVWFVGDPYGFDAATEAAIQESGALPISVGPMSLHAEDAIAIVHNELDRRAAGWKANSPSPAR